MKAGDRIRVFGSWGETSDHTIEEFRYCLGYFASDKDRKANVFQPLCSLYKRGPDSVDGYIINLTYYTNPVQAWADIPK